MLVSPEMRVPVKHLTPVALHTCLVVSASARRSAAVGASCPRRELDNDCMHGGR